MKLFTTFGIPEILHSDQGRNFESTILRQTLEAFGINKSRTTAYHPQCDGMVEHLNRSLLQLLRTYVTKQEDWERHLPLVLYAYHSATHTSTGVSPFNLMFGRPAKINDMYPTSTAFDPVSYQGHLQAKLAELRDLVETHLGQAAESQKHLYDRHSVRQSFQQGDLVWLSIPTAAKLDPRWEGKWMVKSIKKPITMEITDGERTKVVHVNRPQSRIQPQTTTKGSEWRWLQGNHLMDPTTDWSPVRPRWHTPFDNSTIPPTRTTSARPFWLLKLEDELLLKGDVCDIRNFRTEPYIPYLPEYKSQLQHQFFTSISGGATYIPNAPFFLDYKSH